MSKETVKKHKYKMRLREKVKYNLQIRKKINNLKKVQLL